MSDEQALAPCPFCGNDMAGRRPKKDDCAYLSPAQWAVWCLCGASGANAESNAEAIAAWNRRADSPEIAALKARVGELEAKLAKATPWEQICRRCGIRDSWKPDNDPQF